MHKSITGVFALLLLLIALFLHLSIGSHTYTLSEVTQALFFYDSDNFSHLVIRELRLPRALVAMLVGGSLAVSGAIMQGVTRNPLADPSVLGMMSGGSLTVVLALNYFGTIILPWVPFIAAIGAMLSAMIVWFIASRANGGVSALSLILAGSAFSAFSVALLSLLNLLHMKTFEQMRVWLVGSLTGSNVEALQWGLPWLMVGLIGALVLAPSVTALSMGDQIATGLGLNISRKRWQLLVCVVLLTAVSISLAGPLGFIGLVIPHVVRVCIGSDYRVVIPYSLLCGAIYLLLVDSFARWIIQPNEIATGIITLLIGAPMFILLVKNKVH